MKRVRICILKNGVIYKITSLYLLKDGSFKIDVPYCPFEGGVVTKFSPKYGERRQTLLLNKSFGLTKRPQLSVHASGFVHFSGPGIKSGIDEDTKLAKGAGVYSAPLYNPITSGPTCIILLWGIENFEIIDQLTKEDLVIKEEYINKQFGIIYEDKIENVVLNSYSFHLFVFPETLEEKIFIGKNGEEARVYFPHYYDSGRVGAEFSFSVFRLENINSFLGLIPFKTYTEFPNKIPFGFQMSGPAGTNKPNLWGKSALIYNTEELKFVQENHSEVNILTAFSFDDSSQKDGNLDF